MIPSEELATALTTSRTLVRRLLGELVEANHSTSLERAESPSIMLLASLIVKDDPSLGPAAARQALVPRQQPAPPDSSEGAASKPAPRLSRRELLDHLDEVGPQELVDYVLRQNHVSARTRYNLACYYTTLAAVGGEATRKGCLELALKSLERSLEGGGLTDWASRDPSLQLLRTALPKRFAEALADHALSPHTAPSAAAPEEKEEEETESGAVTEAVDPVPLLADLLATAGPEADIVAGGSEEGFDYAVRGPEGDVLVVATEKPDWAQTEALFDAAEAWEIVPRLVLAVPGAVKVPAPLIRRHLKIEVLPIDAES